MDSALGLFPQPSEYHSVKKMLQAFILITSLLLYVRADELASMVHSNPHYQSVYPNNSWAIGKIANDFGSVYYNGAVAAEHPACSDIGSKIMQQGGNAVDATISSLLCVGVVHNFASGIGGGGFMLIQTPNGDSEVIDFREAAPKSAHRDMFNQNKTLATDSSLGFAVPGEIRGMALAHSRHGGLPWRNLFLPSIEIARNGFICTEKIQEMIHRFKKQLGRSPAMVETYFRSDGSPKQTNDLIVRENLAKTLEIIAEKGPDAFYEGEIAESIVSLIQSLDGGVTMEDMQNYQPIIRQPIYGTFNGFDIITAGAPTSGAILIEILQILDRISLDGNQLDPSSRQKIIEAFKFSYPDRMKLGDPAFIENITWLIEEIISTKKADVKAPKITDNKTHPPEYYIDQDAKWDAKELHGTTHVSAIDSKGFVVAATSTVNLEWGCRIMDPKTGIILNDEMDDFSIPDSDNSFGLPPSKANYVAAGKRPLSSSAPAILMKDGQVFMVIGGAGGSRIVTAVAQTILNVISFKMSPSDAVKDCRLHHQLTPDYILAESRCDRDLLDSLKSYGHKMLIMAPKRYASAIYMVQRMEDGGFIPVSDDRKGGIASGY